MKIARLLLIALVFASAPAAAGDPASRASVERLMELTEVPKMLDSVYGQVGTMFSGLAEQLQLSEEERPAFEAHMQKVSDLMREEMGWEQLKDPMIDIYLRHLSEQEIQGLITFYESDIGRSMSRKMPLVMQDSMAISQQMVVTMMPKIQALAAEMQQEIVAARNARGRDQGAAAEAD